MSQQHFLGPLAALLLAGSSTLALPAHSKSEDLSKARKAVRLQQFDQAFTLYQASAEAGAPDAQYQVANMLLQGQGVEKNEAKARQWLQKASEQNHAGAQFVLSQLLDASPEQAQALLQASAAQGYTPAITQLKRRAPDTSNHVVSSFEKQWFGAVRHDKLHLMESLLNDPSKLNTLDAGGRTALFYAAEFNSEAVLHWLIDKGIDIDHQDHLGLTALQTAVERDRSNITKSLIKAGSNPKQSFSNGDTLLHYAIRLKRYGYVDDFIKAGVPINERNKDGWTALDIAEFQKASTTVSVLRGKGAQRGNGWQKGLDAQQNLSAINAQLEELGRLTPAAMAIINSNKELLTQLVQQDHEVVNQSLENGNTLLTLAVKQNKPKMIEALLSLGANVNQTGYKGTTALQLASRLGNLNLVQMLLAADASITHKDSKGEDALLSAIREGHQDVSKILLDHILGKNEPFSETRDKLKTSGIPVDHYVLLAAQHQEDDTIERLLPFASQKPTTDKQERNALWFAAKHSNAALIEKLLKAGISAKQLDTLGRTPFTVATQQGCLPCSEKLLPHSDINHKTNSGNTALILAAGSNDAEMTAWLIKHKAIIDTRNQKGDTALMAAVDVNDLKIARLLIAAKANISRKNRLGFSAMDLAEKSSPQMVDLLKSNSVLGVF